MKPPQILIVEDEHALALALGAAVRQAGATGEVVPNATQARMQIESGRPFDALILDIGLPDQNGLEFLASLNSASRPPTVMVTAHGDIENTIAARKLGVVEFLTKPLDFELFQNTLKRLFHLPPPERETSEVISGNIAFIGAAASMRPVFQQIAHSCASEDPVLIRGETGSGKSHVASLVRANSNRSGPALTIASGPATTAEEIATALRDSAEGVLIIEEVSLLQDDVQAELVRQIEAESESRLPRMIATTSDDLREQVSNGKFRSDLFYRLQVLEVRLPPLRERMEDLPALVSYFLGQLQPERTLDLADAAMEHLNAHSWPGNLRELRNSIAYALTVSTGAPILDVSDFPPHLNRDPRTPSSDKLPNRLIQALDTWIERELSEGNPRYRDLADTLEAMLIRRILRRFDGKLARMASALQANRTTLRKRLKEADAG